MKQEKQSPILSYLKWIQKRNHLLQPVYSYSRHGIRSFILFLSISEPELLGLKDVLSSISHRWYEFGNALGIERRVLDGFKHVEAPMSAVVEFWWNGNVGDGRPVTWQSVVEALERIDEHALAKEIFEKHCGGSTYACTSSCSITL